jgi:hypothetical protein
MSKVIRKYCRRETFAFAILALAILGVSILFYIGPASFAAPKKTKIDTPVIACDSSTQTSINVLVTAPSGPGATGLPAGFSIQWQTAADFALFGWPSDSACPPDVNGNPTCGDSFCKGSFSGNANLSRYNLLPGDSVSVNIGEFLFDQGASTNCPGGLVCGTQYVFRAFGHATSTLNRSNFTDNLLCSTLPCGGGDTEDCTLTQGFWKTHGPAGCVTGNNTNEWPVNSLTLGNVNYTDSQLCSIMNTPAAGNGLIALAHQLIATKLNIANGASHPAAIDTAIADADALIGNLVIPPVGNGSLPASSTSVLTSLLANYNEGATGPGHCGQ